MGLISSTILAEVKTNKNARINSRKHNTHFQKRRNKNGTKNIRFRHYIERW